MADKSPREKLLSTAETMLNSTVKIIIGPEQDFEKWSLEELESYEDSILDAKQLLESQLVFISRHAQKIREIINKR